jgi:hypothetical protein
MGGSVLVGIAEVAVYSGYVWHLGQAKKQDRTLKEVKEIVQTWTVEGPEPQPSVVGGRSRTEDGTVRAVRRRQREVK